MKSLRQNLALNVAEKAGLLSRTVHIDSTTLSLYGSYDTEDQKGPKPLMGYSKDHRPDLKQVTLQFVSLGKGCLPIWMEALDGNSSDKKSFPETVKRVDKFYGQINAAPKMCFIGDSALYGQELDKLNVDWLTRVPESYGECKSLCNLKEVDWEETKDERYKIYPYEPQQKKERWLLVRSEPAFQRESETFYKKHERSFEEIKKLVWHCSCQIFHCEKDAKKAIEKVIQSKKHFYQVNYQILQKGQFKGKGRPKKNQTPDQFEYQISITGIASDYEKIKRERETLGRFVLATNVLNQESLSTESMLLDYKDQGEIERGFRFIKNDTFGLDDVYLKKRAE